MDTRSTIARRAAPRKAPAVVHRMNCLVVEISTKYTATPENIIESTALITEVGIKILNMSTRFRTVARKNPVKQPTSSSSSMGASYYVFGCARYRA